MKREEHPPISRMRVLSERIAARRAYVMLSLMTVREDEDAEAQKPSEDSISLIASTTSSEEGALGREKSKRIRPSVTLSRVLARMPHRITSPMFRQQCSVTLVRDSSVIVVDICIQVDRMTGLSASSTLSRMSRVFEDLVGGT